MKKVIVFLMAVGVLTMLIGCGSEASTGSTETLVENNENSDSVSVPTKDQTEDNLDDIEADDSNGTLVVYFSRTGENYGVGVVDEGNTAIVADMIANQMNANEFEIIPVSPYPDDYEDTLVIAQQESSEKALPEYQGDVEEWDTYNTIFIGYPIWYGDMPRIVYTFLENHDWTGKTVIPFDTHGGSGLAQTENTIANETGAKVLEGLPVLGTDAQENQDSVKKDVQSWLEGLDL